MPPLDPEELAAAGVPADSSLPAATRMGAVHLSVASLVRALDFYEHAVGLRVHERDDDRAVLGAGGEDLLVLCEQPGARPARGFCGLFHVALLLPHRADLARWLIHAVRDQVALTGLSDHFVSEAIYLQDPDDHGLEIYWDRPRALWEGLVGERLTTLPLDTDDLVAELADPRGATFDGLPAGTTVGHVHLRVASVPETIVFYRDVLGFGLMAALGVQAAFLGAGGYHHHIGGNTWESAGAPPAPSDRATLRAMTIVLPDAEARDDLGARLDDGGYEPEVREGGSVHFKDPSGNPVVLR